MPCRQNVRWLRGLRTLMAGLAVVALARFALPAPAWAEDPPKNPSPPGISELTLADEIPVSDVLKNLSKISGKAILWSDQDKAVTSKKILGSNIIFRAPTERIFDTIRAVLTFQEIILIPIGAKGYEVYVAMDARQLASQFILKNKPVYVELTDAKADEIENQDGLFVATTIKVKNIDNLRDARTALQRIITQNNIGSVQEVPAARAFVVTDFAPNVVAIYRLLKEMDVQPEGKKVQQKYLPLDFALAEDIEPILQDLFTGKQRVSNVPQGQPGSPRHRRPRAAHHLGLAHEPDHRVRDGGRHRGDQGARQAPRHEAHLHDPDRLHDSAQEPPGRGDGPGPDDPHRRDVALRLVERRQPRQHAPVVAGLHEPHEHQHAAAAGHDQPERRDEPAGPGEARDRGRQGQQHADHRGQQGAVQGASRRSSSRSTCASSRC